MTVVSSVELGLVIAVDRGGLVGPLERPKYKLQ